MQFKKISICPECNPNGSNYLQKYEGILSCDNCGWIWTIDEKVVCSICNNLFEVGYHIGHETWLKHNYPACLEQQEKTTKRRERKRDKNSLTAYKSAEKRNEIKRRSVRKWLQIKWLRGYKNIPYKVVAGLADTMAKEKMMAVMFETAEKSGCEPKRRLEISDWASRKCPRVRVDKFSYYLTEIEKS